MEFKTNDNQWIIGYPINESYSLIEQKAFHLLSIVNGSSKSNAIHDLGKIFVKDFEMSEVSRILIEIAAQIRNKIDTTSTYEGYTYNPNSIVGKLYTDSRKKIIKSSFLTFREACNKILHAKHVNFDLKRPSSIRSYEKMNPVIYLYGDHYNLSWKAKLDIVKFIIVLVTIN